MKNKQTSNKLLENSIAAALSAIEIYNKPHFPYRNEVFCILSVNAWELLFKTKILADNNDDIESLYVYDNKDKLKTNRNGAPLTIEIYGAMDKLKVSQSIYKNVSTLIDIRDTAIHFISAQPIDYLVYSLGAACLRNYQKCIKDWFSRDLLEYNFYIMPLGFAHNFKAFKLLDLEKEPTEIKRLINQIKENQQNTTDDGFVFNCEIQINLVSAKKITEETDLSVSVNPTATEYVVIEKPQKLTDRYPLSSDELWTKLKIEIPALKQNIFYDFLKVNKIRDTEKFSVYNFRYKKHEAEYLKTGKVIKGTTSLYNEECFRHMLQEIPKSIKIKNSTSIHRPDDSQ